MMSKYFLSLFFLFMLFVSFYLIYKEEENLIADGFISSPNKNTFSVRNKTPGYIDKILFPNLSNVNKNDLIMVISSDELNNDIDQQKIKLESFEKQKKIILKSLDELYLNYELLISKINSYSPLIEQGFIKPNFISDLYIRKNQVNFDIEEKKLQLQKIIDEISLIKNFLNNNIQSVSEFSLYAPISGVINYENKTVGLFLEKNSIVFNITELNTKANTFEFYIKPIDLENVNVGQEVKLIINKDIFSSDEAFGIIDYIEPNLVEFGDAPYYKIIGTLDKSFANLYDSGIQLKVVFIKQKLSYNSFINKLTSFY